jgi:hypothetical protein
LPPDFRAFFAFGSPGIGVAAPEGRLDPSSKWPSPANY